MEQVVSVHIVDPNRNRGQAIACQLCTRSFCVEMHEGLSDFLCRPRAGVILMNDDQEATDPAKALEAIAESTGYLAVAFFSSSLSPHRAVRAMSAGVVDYFEWPCAPAELGEIVVRLIVQGERRATLETLEAHARELVAGLAEREQHVLRCVVAGAGDRQVAGELGISLERAAIHRMDMMSRLDAGSMSDAVRIGIYAGLGVDEGNSKGSGARHWAPFGETALVG